MELAALDLPESLRDAIREARSIRSRGAGARQRQYIGRLMREVDVAEIRRALAARGARAALEAQRFQRLEAWRARLIEEPVPALEQLARLHPQVDRGAWGRAVEAARAERTRLGGTSGEAFRELFRMLRALFQSAEPPESADPPEPAGQPESADPPEPPRPPVASDGHR